MYASTEAPAIVGAFIVGAFIVGALSGISLKTGLANNRAVKQQTPSS